MERYELPDGWEWSTIDKEYQVNQRDPKLRELPNDLPVSFVPMAAVDAECGVIATPDVKPLGEVRKGFTPFSNGDVIFARITPSMENGKAAIARELENGLGFGSTEFHVMRPTNGNLPEWVFYFIRQKRFRDEAKTNFTGTAGQLRVPDKFIRNSPIPIPSPTEQHRIVIKIESLFAEARTARAALERAEPLLKKFRQAVLSAAFRGELTERDANDEPASVLLERIRAERINKWQNDLRAKGKDTTNAKFVEAEPPNIRELGELPEAWEWATVEQIAEVRLGRQRSPARAKGPHMRPYLRSANVTWAGLDLSDVKEMDFTPQEQETYRLKRGDIVLVEGSGSISEVGKPAMWKDEIENCCMQNTLIRVRTDAPLPEYLHLHFQYDALGARFRHATKGIGINHLGAQGLSEWVIALPPLAEQQRIVERVESLFAQAEQIERAVEIARRRAENVEQAILARAFRGEL